VVLVTQGQVVPLQVPGLVPELASKRGHRREADRGQRLNLGRG
jgi:hypothetical protein